MTVTIEILPFSDSLDMYGEPDKSAAYSLSGNISISLSSSSSFFERRRTIRLLLQSLTVVFEGQSELITPETGYAPCRLCSVSKELLLDEPVELSNEGHEDSDKPCVWNVVFNLTVPGWLPATSAFGDVENEEAGTRYALYATAKFVNLDDGRGRSWLSACCTSFRSQTRIVRAPRCDIQLNRFMNVHGDSPSSSLTSLSSTVDYSVYAEPQEMEGVKDASRIPTDILSKLRAIISVPEYADMTENSLPLCLRLRTKDLPQEQCKRLRITDFSLELEQTEQYRTAPSSSYTSRFPVPPPSEQPPRKPLLRAHPLQAIYEIGFAAAAPPKNIYTRAFSLLPGGASGRYSLAGDGYVFAEDADSNHATWYSIRTYAPFVHVASNSHGAPEARKYRLRESGQSPLLSVNHRLYVALTCTYDLTDGDNPERATERLQFHIPLRFARVLLDSPLVSRPVTPSPSPPLSARSSSSSLSSLDARTLPLGCGSPLASLPYAQALPAYSQLFDLNGERKIDYSIPLPAYTPRAPCSFPSSSSSLSSLELGDEIINRPKDESDDLQS
ncbi:hypothetical protein AcW1_006085 [Taiwanofungus camphoratus]|nr:hypothetical protein AcV7_008662 [Antrodia cinnamomea]KAI0957812.1 hypothetical protein AcW1_006085 [Antrodia cinnamomea]